MFSLLRERTVRMQNIGKHLTSSIINDEICTHLILFFVRINVRKRTVLIQNIGFDLKIVDAKFAPIWYCLTQCYIAKSVQNTFARLLQQRSYFLMGHDSFIRLPCVLLSVGKICFEFQYETMMREERNRAATTMIIDFIFQSAQCIQMEEF